MLRIFQVALLFAIIIPFGMLVRAFVEGLSGYWRDMGVAALVGFALCYALWRWHDRIKERQSRGEFSFWD